ncbi:MAG: XDD3 family exosortase-dependent surface protein [Leptolyngbyaceae cyanobacterium]
MTRFLRSFTPARPWQQSCLSGLAFSGVALALIASSSPAATLNYTADSATDGVTGPIVGGGDFELYGLGYVQQGNDLFVGLNTNLPVGGFIDPFVTGGSIAWGDMFFDFADPALNLSFEEALAAGWIYGVRFDAANDSSVALGLYQVTATKSVVQTNNGFESFAAYTNAVVAGGGTPSLGEIPLDGSYLGTGLPQNEIADGTFLGEVTFIEDFSTVGFAPDFGFGSALSQTGRFTYGFRVDSALLPSRDFVAHVLAECINDGLAFRGEITAIAPPSEEDTPPEKTTVPEPGGLLGMAIASGILALSAVTSHTFLACDFRET